MDLSHDFLYAGYYEPQWDFVSGMATFFNRNTLGVLKMYADELDRTIYDDVAIGRVLLNQKVPRTFIDRYNISERKVIVTDEEFSEAFKKPQIRIRNDHNRELIDFNIWQRVLSEMGIG